MQHEVFATISNFQVVGYQRHRQQTDSYYAFPKCTTLCSVAIRAFRLLRNEFVVPKTAQCSFILTRLPKFAQLKLQEWYHDQPNRSFTHKRLLGFAQRVDSVHQIVKTDKNDVPYPQSILRLRFNTSKAVKEYADS